MDYMIDIETLSTKPNSLILTVGIIKFNKDNDITALEKMESLYLRINKDSCEKLGMDINQNTVEWWSKQSKESKYEVFENKDRFDIKDALLKISSFLKGHKNIWAHSPNFDIIILENAYNMCGLDIPWKFWDLRDTRTVYSLASVNLKDFSSKNDKHNSLLDSYSQILALKQSFDNLGLGKRKKTKC